MSLVGSGMLTVLGFYSWGSFAWPHPPTSLASCPRSYGSCPWHHCSHARTRSLAQSGAHDSLWSPPEAPHHHLYGKMSRLDDSPSQESSWNLRWGCVIQPMFSPVTHNVIVIRSNEKSHRPCWSNWRRSYLPSSISRARVWTMYAMI